jgi:hypothetical protein
VEKLSVKTALLSNIAAIKVNSVSVCNIKKNKQTN